MLLNWRHVHCLLLSLLIVSAVHGIALTSPAFVDGGVLPEVYMEQESELSPPLLWVDAPKYTRSFVLIVDEPQESGPAVVHWILYNIPAKWSGVPENVLTLMGEGHGSPIGGANSWAKTDWVGAMPDSTALRFRLFAMKHLLRFEQSPNVEDLLAAMDDQVLASDEIIATVGD